MSIEMNMLKKLQDENVFVDIFTDLFNESFYGFIRQYNKDFLLLEHYNDDGLYNGVIVFRRTDITRIRWGNNDIKSVQKIITKHDQKKNIASVKIENMLTILKSINKVFQYVNINIQDIDSGMCIIGEIKDMDKTTVVINEFGTRAALDRGLIMLSVKDITRVDAGGIYEVGLLKIHGKK